MGTGILRRSLGFLALAVGAGALAPSAARASLLAPGATLFPAPGEAGPVGATLVGSASESMTAPTFTALVNSQAFTNDASNPFGLDKVTFTYRITNTDTDGTPTPINRVTVSEFGSFLADASWLSPGTGTSPAYIDRDLTGKIVGFTFNPALGAGSVLPGTSSALLVVQTDAKDFGDGTLSAIDGSTGTVHSLVPAPSAGVPEPASLSLVLVGAAGLLRRRRR